MAAKRDSLASSRSPPTSPHMLKKASRSGKGECKAATAPWVNRPRNPRLKTPEVESEIIAGSGIHNNKLAIYLPVSGLPLRESHKVTEMAAFHQQLFLLLLV
ncbi:uncharacterized [Tachysurus ichikawai]